jgi:hypothetical protein
MSWIRNLPYVQGNAIHRPYFILLLLINNVEEDSKDHIHNPLSVAIDEVILKEDKMIEGYTEKGTFTVLLDYNETFKKFSLSRDKNGHMKNFKNNLFVTMKLFIWTY